MATPVTVNIPDETLLPYQKVADDSGQSLEQVILEALSFPGVRVSTDSDMETELARLQDYTDLHLWLVVHTHLSIEQSTHLDELIERGKSNLLSETEQGEMESLLTMVENYMLLRSEALILLKQRGYDVSRFFKQDDL